MTSDLPVIRMIPQRHDADCSVSCLASAFGVSYEDALLAMPEAGQVLTSGAYARQIQGAAKRLGRRLRVRRRIDFDADGIGILRVSAAGWSSDHLVLLVDGSILDGADFWRDASDYLAHNKASTVVLLTVEDD